MNLSTYTTPHLAVAFNAITGASIKKFENRQKAEQRIVAALSDRGLTEAAIADAISGKAFMAQPPASPEVGIRSVTWHPASDVDAGGDDVPAFLKKGKPSLTAMADAVEAGEKIETPETIPVAVKTQRERKAKVTGGERGKTKNEIMLDMVCSSGGATEGEICAAIGWKACLVTLRRAAAAGGVILTARKDEGSRKNRYFGTR